MQSKAKNVEDYLAELPEDRRVAISSVRDAILKNLPEGFEEGMQYGMIGYYVPHSLYPDGYHCNPKQPLPFTHLASQKNYMSLYLMCICGDETLRDWFVAEWEKTGLQLNMGKSCVRFKTLEDIPLKLIGQAIRKVSVKQFVNSYEKSLKK